MRQPLRIAILECDTPIGRAKEKYGGYGNLFKELLENSAQKYAEQEGLQSAPKLDVKKYDVVNQEVYPSLGEVDGVLLTGSKWNSFDDDPWILKLVGFTKECLEKGVRLVGVCFGHQIIGRALGVEAGRNERGWEVAVTRVELSEKGKEIFKLDELAIHQMHRDIVHTFPPGIESLGRTGTCEVQGMYAKKRLITVQGHPEFYEGIMEDLINTRHQMGIFDDAMAEESMKRAHSKHDGVVVGAAFIRFLVEE